MNNSQVPIARKEGLVIQEMPDEVLVYDLDENKAFCLNPTAAEIWKACDGRKSVADIARELPQGKDQDSRENVVWLALDQLREKNLITNDISSRFAGQSRREVLKQVGLATALALPVVAMLTFPKSVSAEGPCAPSNVCAPGSAGCLSGETCCPTAGEPQCVGPGTPALCGTVGAPGTLPCPA